MRPAPSSPSRARGSRCRDIAEHAGVNFGLIYQYVGTKDQLVREVYARGPEPRPSG